MMLIRVVILSISFLSAAAYIEKVSQPEPVPLRHSLSGVSMQIGAWRGRNSADLDQNVVALLGVDDYLSRVYVSDNGAMLGLYVGYYESQRQGSSIHSPLNCLPGAGWNPVERSVVSIPVETSPGAGATRHIEVNRILIEKGAEKRLVLYWYQSHGRVVANEYMGKLYTVVDAIRTNRTDAALVRVITPIPAPDYEQTEAQHAAVDFVQQIFPLLARYLPE